MKRKEKTKIEISTIVNSPVEKVWKTWTSPEHILKWNNASPDWHTTRAENDLRKGGKFSSRMEAKDGSFGFDFWGIYDRIIENELIEYTLGDERRVIITFQVESGKTKIIEIFEAENENSVEMQQFGWQAILDNYKKYTESLT